MGEVRTIAVMGATGRQGRGVIEALQNISTKSIEKQIQYAIRPMTRSLTSKLAREFELDFPHLSLVQWRQDDTDSITECFDGCYGAFIDTGMFHVPETSMLELTRGEIALGKRCLEAAKTASLSHIIYPTFPSIFNASNGSINIRRFETKHQISLEIHASSVPSTVLCPGPFYTDLYEPQYASWDGTTVIFSTTAAPETSVGFADPSHDIGLFTRAALDRGAQYMAGEEIPVCGPPLTYAELAARFTAVTGIQAAYRQCGLGEFEDRFAVHVAPDKRDMGALGKWWAGAPRGRAGYGTVGLERLERVEGDLGVRAVDWEGFLGRRGWMRKSAGAGKGTRRVRGGGCGSGSSGSSSSGISTQSNSTAARS